MTDDPADADGPEPSPGPAADAAAPEPPRSIAGGLRRPQPTSLDRRGFDGHNPPRSTAGDFDGLRPTPLLVAGFVFLAAGLALAVYNGLAWLDLVPVASWVGWSHIHFVTVGGFTQLVLGMVPQLAARRLDQPAPSRRYHLAAFAGLNGGFLLLWYGRGFGHPWAFDLGLVVAVVLVLGYLLVLLRMALRSDRGWDVGVGLYLLSAFVFLWGIVYAYGLWAHPWDVPGGWLGLREAHVHANAWGFLAFAVVATLYDLIPRLAGVDLHSRRLQRYSFPLFAVGIFPLITGPWLGMGRSVTATGLVLYAAGFALYLYTLVATYRAGRRSGLGLSLVASQVWLLGPAGFAPFVLFGVEWVPPAYVEQAALHFFFVGWALPVALGGLALFARTQACPAGTPLGLALDVAAADRATGDDAEAARETDGAVLATDAVADVVPRAAVWTWNLAVLVVGVGFLYQDAAWSAALFGVGSLTLSALWLYYLVQPIRLRLGLVRAVRSA